MFAMGPAFFNASTGVPITLIAGLHFDGTSGSSIFTDVAGNAWAQIGSAALSSSQSKFGGTSLSCLGTGSGIQCANSVVAPIGTGDFSLAAWVYPTSTDANCAVFRTPAAGTALYISANSLQWYRSGSVLLTPVNSVPLNTWTYVTADRQDGQLILSAGGLVTSAVADATDFSSISFMPGIGINTNQDIEGLNGYIDDFTLSSASRFRTNFTPPTAPF